MPDAKLWGTLDPFFEGGGIMGRNVANREFLRALLRLDPFDEYHFFLGDSGQARDLSRQLERAWPEMWSRGRFHVAQRLDLPEALARRHYHCFHLSDCITSQPHLARLRNAVSGRIFPITGVTHSLSYARYGRELAAHLWPGCTGRDCIVATSSAAREVLERWFGLLRRGLGADAAAWPGPRLEIVPLGVDAKALRPPDPAERAAARKRWRLAPDRPMILVFARLSHQSKMDLLPVLRLAQRLAAAGAIPSGLRLCLAGAMEEKGKFTDTLLRLAANMDLDCQVVENPDEAAKRDLFRAADVFLSPVDNLQETFGLTVLEAGAMGLPAVVSDFDGYRDLVVHAETGFLVPTTGPGPTPEVDLAAPLAFDSQYHLLLAQQTVVDVAAMAGFTARLLADEGLRRAMGRAARERVVSGFTWEGVAGRFRDLWDRLWEEPVDERAARCALHPLHVDYGQVFGGYPTRSLAPDMRLRWSASGEAVYRGREFPIVYDPIEARIEPEALQRLVFFARKAITAGRLMEKFARAEAMAAPAARFYLLWALKQDLLEFVHDPAPGLDA